MKDKLEKFVENEYQKALNYVKKEYSSKNSYDAEDILQEAILTTWKIIRKGNIIDNIGAYIYRSIKNKIIDIHRKKETNMELRIEGLDEKSYLYYSDKVFQKDLLESIEKKDFKKIFKKSLKELPEKYRKIWTEVEIENKSYQKLSRNLSMGKNNLRVMKYRANKKLKAILYNKMKGEL